MGYWLFSQFFHLQNCIVLMTTGEYTRLSILATSPKPFGYGSKPVFHGDNWKSCGPIPICCPLKIWTPIPSHGLEYHVPHTLLAVNLARPPFRDMAFENPSFANPSKVDEASLNRIDNVYLSYIIGYVLSIFKHIISVFTCILLDIYIYIYYLSKNVLSTTIYINY